MWAVSAAGQPFAEATESFWSIWKSWTKTTGFTVGDLASCITCILWAAYVCCVCTQEACNHTLVCCWTKVSTVGLISLARREAARFCFRNCSCHPLLCRHLAVLIHIAVIQYAHIDFIDTRVRGLRDDQRHGPVRLRPLSALRPKMSQQWPFKFNVQKSSERMTAIEWMGCSALHYVWENKRAATICNHAGEMQISVCFGVSEPQQNMGVSEYLWVFGDFPIYVSAHLYTLHICVMFHV